MERECSLPPEWMHILMSDNPPLSLEYLIHHATIQDIYDALELIELRTYTRIEAGKIEDGSNN